MKLSLWHKSLLASVLLLPVGLWAFHSDLSANVAVRQSSRFSAPRPPVLTNKSSSDELVEAFEPQLMRFLRKEGLRGGVSVAISRGGRLVFAKGFGWASVEDSATMEPYNILRVASVSKLITAVAVMRLVESGRLTLDQRVFGPTGILNGDTYLNMKDKRMTQVTVRNLLNHSGGWTTRYGDPMFMPYVVSDEMGKELPVSMEDIIRFMQCKSMHFTPGAYSSYSNFGYGILGEVVAEAAQMPYEDYVQSEVFAPLGVYSARLGYSHQQDRLPGEVHYYEPDTAFRTTDYAVRGNMARRAYGGSDIHTLGAAGGWVVSAPDLVKLTLTIDGFASVPDQLSQHSIDIMTDEMSRFDPLGWRKIISDTWFRTGTLSATSAILCRRPDGICFAAILNSSNALGPNLAVALANKMNEIINKIALWPERDLWSDDLRWQAYKQQKN